VKPLWLQDHVLLTRTQYERLQALDEMMQGKGAAWNKREATALVGADLYKAAFEGRRAVDIYLRALDATVAAEVAAEVAAAAKAAVAVESAA